MALATSTIDLPIVTAPAATPRYRRRRPRTWKTRAYEIATDTARRLPWALVACAAFAVVVLTALGALVPRLGDALAVAAVLAVLTGAGLITWKATNR